MHNDLARLADVVIMKYIALYFVFILTTDRSNIDACTTDQFECNDGKCINAEYECDDNFECDDYSDELNCVVIPPCPEGQYKCNNGECTVAGARCNGIEECNDRSDEQNCGSSSLWEPIRISTYSENSSSIFLPLELHHTTVPDSAVELDSTEVAPKMSISSPDKTVYATSSVHHVSSIVTLPTYSKFTEYTSFLDKSFLSVDMSSVVQTPPLQSITTPFPVSLKMTVSSEDYLNSIFFVTNETLMKSQTATFVKELSSPVKFYSSICHTNIGSCISRWLSSSSQKLSSDAESRSDTLSTEFYQLTPSFMSFSDRRSLSSTEYLKTMVSSSPPIYASSTFSLTQTVSPTEVPTSTSSAGGDKSNSSTSNSRNFILPVMISSILLILLIVTTVLLLWRLHLRKKARTRAFGSGISMNMVHPDITRVKKKHKPMIKTSSFAKLHDSVHW